MKQKARFNISVDGGLDFLYTRTGLKVSEGFERVVVGARGPYVEFQTEQLCLDSLHIPKQCRYRVGNPDVYYTEYRTKDKAFVKVYRQKEGVGYADYKIDCWYMAPSDLFLENGKSVVVLPPRTPSLFAEEIV